MPRFIISRPDRLGDVTLSTAIPRILKENFPDAYVAVLVRQYASAIYEHNPFVDEILLYDDNGTFRDFIKNLSAIRRKKFDFAFSLLPNERINWLFFAAGIKNRIGVGHKFYQFITNTKSVYRRKYEIPRSEADYCYDFLRKIGINPGAPICEIYLTDNEKQHSVSLRNKIAPNGEKIIGIHYSSGNSAPNMPVQEYARLARYLLNVNNLKLIITDKDIPPEMNDLPKEIFVNAGIPLRASIVNIAACDLLISGSTGPMHICCGIESKNTFCILPLTGLRAGAMGTSRK